jgi:hypothetical protein
MELEMEMEEKRRKERKEKKSWSLRRCARRKRVQQG